MIRFTLFGMSALSFILSVMFGLDTVRQKTLFSKSSALALGSAFCSVAFFAQMQKIDEDLVQGETIKDQVEKLREEADRLERGETPIT